MDPDVPDPDPDVPDPDQDVPDPDPYPNVQKNRIRIRPLVKSDPDTTLQINLDPDPT